LLSFASTFSLVGHLRSTLPPTSSARAEDVDQTAHLIFFAIFLSIRLLSLRCFCTSALPIKPLDDAKFQLTWFKPIDLFPHSSTSSWLIFLSLRFNRLCRSRHYAAK
jgi:hypothetical protein